MARFEAYSGWLIPALLFGITFFLLLLTAAPTIYTVDTPELVMAAKSLGIPHAPGYGVYTLIAHFFTLLPLNHDMAYRVNFLSMLALASSVVLIYDGLRRLLDDRATAASLSLTFAWSYYVWTLGLVAEVYAVQVFSLALCGWWFIRLYKSNDRTTRSALGAGMAFGLMCAVHPIAILFAGGMALGLRGLGFTWRRCLYTGCLSAGVFLLSLLYFPIRYAANPALNTAGSYTADGSFQRINLQTLKGIWWLISGKQFKSFFFVDGLLPSVKHITDTLRWFGGNYLWLGFFVGLLGIVTLWKRQRVLLGVWAAFFLPYTYFYLTYGAADRDTMFGPSYLLWLPVMGFGMVNLLESLAPRLKWLLLGALPVLLLIINFPLVNVSDNTELHKKTEDVIAKLPPDAYIFGYWEDIMPALYLQQVENQRPDLKFYNLFLFERDTQRINTFTERLVAQKKNVVYLNNSAYAYLEANRFNLTPIASDFSNPEQPRFTVSVTAKSD